MSEFDDAAEAFGYPQGSEQHAATALLLRYAACQERRGYESCDPCPASMDCSLRLDAQRLIYLSSQPRNPGPPSGAP